jgi:hypothetical protein
MVRIPQILTARVREGAFGVVLADLLSRPDETAFCLHRVYDGSATGETG